MATANAQPRLIADAMLGGLARWLRVLGLDTAYDPDLDDPELVDRALAEERTILTRDRRLIQRRRAGNHLFVRSEVVDEQVAQVLAELRLAPHPEALFSRCLRCNAPLREIPAEEAAREVPPYVARTQERFRRCPACGRIYWRATHARRRRTRLRRLGIEAGP
ncbi:MAG TPA: Mut7-C RNAse domain-containing protein [Thermoanaerobaculia bacterium]|nr:Mut7-C RNAse domain-containing protein [Thermoanaerobaculia bacterium]